jgi:hypothetical protein
MCQVMVASVHSCICDYIVMNHFSCTCDYNLWVSQVWWKDWWKVIIYHPLSMTSIDVDIQIFATIQRWLNDMW